MPTQNFKNGWSLVQIKSHYWSNLLRNHANLTTRNWQKWKKKKEKKKKKKKKEVYSLHIPAMKFIEWKQLV